MKRFIVFLFESEEGDGWSDAISDKNGNTLSFDTIKEAKAEAQRRLEAILQGGAWQVTREVVDLRTGKIINCAIIREGGGWVNIF